MVNATMGAPMTRAEALQWCVDKLGGWPTFGVQILPMSPAGWEWVLSASQNWYLKNTEKHGDAILGSHYKDACYLRDQNNIGKAIDVTICGVAARIGERYKFKSDDGDSVGTLAGAHNGDVWFIDCFPGPVHRIRGVDRITGFAPFSERDEFVDHAAMICRSVPSPPAPMTADARDRRFLSALYDAGARFIGPGKV